MILDDFKNGGFPVTVHTPIICTIVTPGSRDPLMNDSRVVYNRYDLKKVMDKYDIVYLLGIWPGKNSTDAYPLDVLKYAKTPVPPEMHKDIDSAIDIEIIMDKDQFEKVIYKPGPRSKDHVSIESSDIKLYDYIISAGLKYKTTFG